MTTQTNPPEGGSTSTDDGVQTFDANYVKGLRAEAAKYRNEAKTNADAARRLAELEEAQKTEAQKLADAKTAAEADAATARAEALRWRIAAKHGITDEQAELFLTGSDEETLTKQAEVLAGLRSSGTNGTPAPRPDLSQGSRQAPASSDPATQFATFLNGQLKR